MYRNVELVRPNTDGLTSRDYPKSFDLGRIFLQDCYRITMTSTKDNGYNTDFFFLTIREVTGDTGMKPFIYIALQWQSSMN